MKKIQAIRGTQDILPGEVERWQRVETSAREVFGRYGFSEMRTPIFEHSEVFVKGTGDTTDVVEKEMYRFTDLGDNDITLRPEGTPPVIRAYLEHNLANGKSIDRYFYSGPMFRYERPQKGRYRQFHQIGVEVLGVESARIDAEVISMALTWLQELEVADPVLKLNTVGDEETRVRYRAALVAAQAERLDELCDDCRRRHVTNPLRVLDCKKRGCQAVIATMPVIQDSLTTVAAQHFDAVCSTLQGWGVAATIDPRMVRGLDYYRQTVFEITSTALGAQDSLLGGGRYDGLVARMGGDDVPGVGFASGVERILLAMPASEPRPAADVVVLAFDEASVATTHRLVHELRHAGVRALTYAYDGRNKKAQSKAAHRSGARWQVVVGPDEMAADSYTLKRIADDHEEVVSGDTLAAHAARLLRSTPTN
jgi:histidyl-tRNA synthetase